MWQLPFAQPVHVQRGNCSSYRKGSVKVDLHSLFVSSPPPHPTNASMTTSPCHHSRRTPMEFLEVLAANMDNPQPSAGLARTGRPPTSAGNDTGSGSILRAAAAGGVAASRPPDRSRAAIDLTGDTTPRASTSGPRERGPAPLAVLDELLEESTRDLAEQRRLEEAANATILASPFAFFPASLRPPGVYGGECASRTSSPCRLGCM